MTYRETMKDLFNKHNAMMAGQYPDGDYLTEFKSICDFFSDATRVKIAIVKSTNKTHAAAFLFPKQE